MAKISRLESRVGTKADQDEQEDTSRRATRKYLVETLKNSNPARYNLPICNSSSIANRFLKFKFDRNEKMFIIHLSNFESDSFFEFMVSTWKFQGENNQISFGHFESHCNQAVIILTVNICNFHPREFFPEKGHFWPKYIS